MARGFGATLGAGTTDSILSAYTATPNNFSMSVRLRRNGDGGGGAGRIFDKIDFDWFYSSSLTSYRMIQNRIGDTGDFTYPAAAASATWYHHGFAFNNGAGNKPAVYIDGVVQTVDDNDLNGTVPVTNSNPICIGNRISDNARVWDGALAEMAWWDVLLTQDEFVALAGGVSPLIIRPTSLQEYVPMLGTPRAYIGGALSNTGTLEQPHPNRVYYPDDPFYFLSAAAAPPSGGGPLVSGGLTSSALVSGGRLIA